MLGKNGTSDGAAVGRRGFVIQAGLVVLGVALVLAPPADGPMLILPLWPTSTAATLGWAFIDVDARLVGIGPLAGSVVVSASRDRLFPAAIKHGALLVAARAVPCVTNFETTK